MLSRVVLVNPQPRLVPIPARRPGSEPRNRRRDLRFMVPLTVEIAGRQHAAPDWSPSGMRVAGWRRNLPLGHLLEGALWVPGVARQFAFRARVARIERNAGLLGLEFLELERGAALAMIAAVARCRARPRRVVHAPSPGACSWLNWPSLWMRRPRG